MMDEAHKKGIKVHPILHPGYRVRLEGEIAQDWGKWAEEGIVDMLCPMIYTNNLELFRKYTRTAVKIANGKFLVYPSIACISSHNKNTPDGVVQSVKIAREEGAQGVGFFSGYSLTEEFIARLKSTVFAKQHPDHKRTK